MNKKQTFEIGDRVKDSEGLKGTIVRIEDDHNIIVDLDDRGYGEGRAIYCNVEHCEYYDSLKIIRKEINGFYRAAKIVESFEPSYLKMFHALSDAKLNDKELIFWYGHFIRGTPDTYKDDNHRVIALLLAQILFDEKAI